MTAVSEQHAGGPGGGRVGDLPREDGAPDATQAFAGEDAPNGQLLREQLSRLVPTHQASLWRYVRYLGADAAEADDLVQETFLAVARSRFEERSEQQTAGYLRAAARNQLLMLRRKQRRQIQTVDLDAADSVWAAAHPDAGDRGWGDLLDSLGDCVDRLEGRPRQAVDLQYRDGASRNDIADRLDMKPDGVKTLLRRARQLLRECLERKQRQEESS